MISALRIGGVALVGLLVAVLLARTGCDLGEPASAESGAEASIPGRLEDPGHAFSADEPPLDRTSAAGAEVGRVEAALLDLVIEIVSSVPKPCSGYM